MFELGFPTSFGDSGYSGGVDYIYLTYDNATVDYGDGALDTTNTPVDVEIFSWPDVRRPRRLTSRTSSRQRSRPAFWVLGTYDAGPTDQPVEAAGYNGVTVTFNCD